MNALLLIVLALVAGEAAPQRSSQNQTATVEGIVKRLDTGEPLSGVRITVRNLPDGSAVTDKQGHFAFEDVPVGGRYTIEAQRDGFFPTANGGPRPSRFAQSQTRYATVPSGIAAQRQITIDAAQNYVVNFDLVAGGNVSGRILDPERQPIPGVKVNLLRQVYESGQNILQPRGSAQTDDLGEFRIFWIEPGEYLLSAEYQPLIPIVGAPNPRESLVRTFYPGVGDETLAIPLNVSGGAELVSNFDLVSNAKVRVIGKVVNSVSNALASSFYLVPRDPRIQAEKPVPIANQSPNRAKGEFEFRGVQPGSYYLFPIVSDQGHTLTGRTPVDVGYQDAEGITAVIRPNIDLNGLIVVDQPPSKRPLTLQNQSLTLIAKNKVPTLQAASLSTIVKDNTGAFQFAGLSEGTYQLASVVSVTIGALYISEMRQGARSVLETGLIEVGPADAEPLQITLKANGGRIEGVVRDSQSNLVPRANVSLIPPPGLRKNPLFYERAVSDAKGHFTFRGIGPGDYKLFACEQLTPGADENPDFIAGYEARGQIVTVTPGISLNVSVELIPAGKK